VKQRKALDLRNLVFCHNVFMSVCSAVLLALILEVVAPMLWNYGMFYAICVKEVSSWDDWRVGARKLVLMPTQAEAMCVVRNRQLDRHGMLR
jgi:hypothetical protein